MKSKSKIFILTFFVSLFFSLLVGINTSWALNLEVNIPGSEGSSISNNGETVSFDGKTTAIAEYIKNIYNYAISIVGIVATIMLMFGGFTWLTAGGSGEKVGKARDIIFGALTGLVLALTSYTILSLVNPDLVNFKIAPVKKPSVDNSDPTPPPSTTNQTIGCCKISTKTSGSIYDRCLQTSKQTCTYFQVDAGYSTVWLQESTCKLIPANLFFSRDVLNSRSEDNYICDPIPIPTSD